MGKLEDYTRNRIEGLAWALSIIDKEENVEQGVENLRKEVRFRRQFLFLLRFREEESGK